LELNVSTYYYKPAEKTEAQKARTEGLRAAIDRWHTRMPYLGCRKLVTKLAGDGLRTHRKEVKRLMDEMGIYALYPKPNLSRRNKQHKVFPYLLRGKHIFLPNQVWAVDITYIKLKHGHMYLTAIIDWYSRYVLSWELSDTLDIGFVLEASRAALRVAVPKIMNSDQGSHYTSPKYTEIFIKAGSAISMDHKGRCFDNIFVERLWRSVKYELTYISEFRSPRELRTGLTQYFEYYNNQRHHQSLEYKTPAQVYIGK